MPSTFFGVEIGKRALSASQLGLDVIGQNISNQNTDGYTRQVVNLQTTDPYGVPDSSPTSPAQLGTGVTVGSVTRIRDEFIDRRVLSATSDDGSLSNLRDILGRVEEAFGEPSTTGIGQLTTNFFNSFSSLTTDPESEAMRSTVLNNASTLVAEIHSVDTALNQINPEISAKIAVRITQVNDTAKQIAILNKQIRLSVANGDQPNDLEDKRGQLLQTLSGLVNLTTTNAINSENGQASGSINVFVGGYALVQDDTESDLPSTTTNFGTGVGLITSTNETIPLESGSVYGLIKATTKLSGYQQQLDTFTGNLINAVNKQHAAGYGLDGSTGLPFFSGTDAGSIDISNSIKTNLDAIAAAAAPTAPNPFSPGNADNARAIANLASAPPPTPPAGTASIGNFTLDEYYNSMVSLVGADSQSYQTQADNQDKVLNTLKTQQSSVSGVSLDEELTRLLQYQRAYQAASRLVTTMDQNVGLIISSLGVSTA